jgi:hypothetical protein
MGTEMSCKRKQKIKYKGLCIEIQRIWNMKCMIIPLITGDTGIVKKRFKGKFGSHTRKTFNRFTSKTTMLGTSHRIRKVWQSEIRRLSGEDHCKFMKRSTMKKRPVTRDKKVVVVVVVVVVIIIIIIIITEHQRITESSHIGYRASEKTNVKL